MLPNSLQYPIAMYGAMRAGLVIVNVNPLYTTDELVYQLNNAGVNTVIALVNLQRHYNKHYPLCQPLKI